MITGDKCEQGIISIFFVLIMPVILISTIGLYMVFFNIQENHSIEKVVYATSETYLSKINSYLFREFGMTATLDEGTLDQMVRYYLTENSLIKKSDEIEMTLEYQVLSKPEHFLAIVMQSAAVSVAREAVDYGVSLLEMQTELNQVRQVMSKISSAEIALSQIAEQYELEALLMALYETELPESAFRLIGDARIKLNENNHEFDLKVAGLFTLAESLKAFTKGITSDAIDQKILDWHHAKNAFDDKINLTFTVLERLEGLYKAYEEINRDEVKLELLSIIGEYSQEKPSILEQLKRSLFELERSFSGVKTGDGVLEFDKSGRISGKSEEEIQMNLIDKVIMNEYFLMVFSSYDENCPRRVSLNGRVDEKRKILGEVEYLISGEVDEVQSLGKIKMSIFGLWWVSNFVSLLSDQNKQVQLTEATVMMPYPWRMVAYTTIATLWCSAESYVEINRLLKGEGVELVKSGNNWHVDLHRLLSHQFSQILGSQVGVDIENQSFSKIYYQDYLRLLLLMQSEFKTLVRAMDLVNLELYIMSNGAYGLDRFSIGHEMDIELVSGKKFKLKNGYVYD
ncbi:MAG TPA: hypothetical protein DCS67_03505 [Clostridiales bacterium UBA8960]|nr:hypothetical protein [Clostridiales bacterium UBA8960]